MTKVTRDRNETCLAADEKNKSLSRIEIDPHLRGPEWKKRTHVSHRYGLEGNVIYSSGQRSLKGMSVKRLSQKFKYLYNFSIRKVI